MTLGASLARRSLIMSALGASAALGIGISSRSQRNKLSALGGSSAAAAAALIVAARLIARLSAKSGARHLNGLGA